MSPFRRTPVSRGLTPVTFAKNTRQTLAWLYLRFHLADLCRDSDLISLLFAGYFAIYL
jgi:hypothetical protein